MPGGERGPSSPATRAGTRGWERPAGHRRYSRTALPEPRRRGRPRPRLPRRITWLTTSSTSRARASLPRRLPQRVPRRRAGARRVRRAGRAPRVLRRQGGAARRVHARPHRGRRRGLNVRHPAWRPGRASGEGRQLHRGGRGPHLGRRQDHPDQVHPRPLRSQRAARGAGGDGARAPGARAGLSGAPERTDAIAVTWEATVHVGDRTVTIREDAERRSG